MPREGMCTQEPVVQLGCGGFNATRDGRETCRGQAVISALASARAHTAATATPRRRFAIGLGAIALFGVLARVVYVEVVGPHTRYFTDSIWYYWLARDVRHGSGYIDIARQFGVSSGHGLAAVHRPTAFWPPAYPGYLVVVQSIFGQSLRASRFAGVVTGAATISLTGMLGRAVAGRTIGLVAALLVACNPLIIALDGSLMSDTLSLPLVLAALLLAQRARERPRGKSWYALGAVIGLAALTREDTLLLVPFVVVPTVLLAHDQRRKVAMRACLGLGVSALVIAPWIVRNAVRVGQPTIATGSSATAIAGANCAESYHGPLLGHWAGGCADLGRSFGMSEVAFSDRVRHQGVSYALDHVGRLPVVVAARVARVWGFWDPRNQARFDHAESRNRSWQELMWPFSLAILALGVVGLRILARRGRQIAMLVAPIAMTTMLAAISYGNTRFRAPAECALTIGAAAALVSMAERILIARRKRVAT